MKGSFIVAALVAAVLCGGCSEPMSPTSPTSVGTGNLSLDSGSQQISVSSGSEKLLPFRGSFEGTQTLTPPDSVNGRATGTGTYLGQFTVEFPHTVNFVTRSGEGTYRFTAANGDELTAHFIGQAQGAPPIVSIVEHATITGGTGRFKSATGSFTVERRFNQANGTTDGSFEGTISSLGARNP